MAKVILPNSLSKAAAYRIKKHLGIFTLIEIIQLINDLRAACRCTFPLSEEPVFIKILSGIGLFYVRSELPTQKHNSVLSNSFKQKAALPDENDWYYYYLAKNETVALMAYAFEGANPEMQGKLFGYPQCCTVFFKDNFNQQNEDLVYAVAKPGIKYSFWNNRAAKLLGYSFISHFPCSWDCKASENIAKLTYLQLKKIYPGYAKKCIKILNQNIIYSTGKVMLIDSKTIEELNGKYLDYFALEGTKQDTYSYLPFKTDDELL